MSIEGFIELTLFTYRLTEDWSDTDPIRFRIRRASIEALKSFVVSDSGVNDALDEMIEVLSWARKEKLITRKEFIFLRDSYESAQKEPVKKIPRKPQKKRPKSNLKTREAKVVKILEKNGRAQVGDLKEEFPEISKRTLRRDIDSLLSKGFIVRKGEWNDVYYTLP